MNYIYFKGLDKSLEEGYKVRAFYSSTRDFVVRVWKFDEETNNEKVATYCESMNVLSALNGASKHVINELVDTETFINARVRVEKNLLDLIMLEGYVLESSKVDNEKIVSVIYGLKEGYMIPIESVMTDDLKSGIEGLNEMLKSFKYPESSEFIDLAEVKMEKVCEEQRKLREQNTTKK